MPNLAAHVPVLGHLVNAGWNLTESTAHAVYGLANKVGLVSSTFSIDDELTTLSYYLSMRQLSPPSKKEFLRKWYQHAGHLPFLLGTNDRYAAALTAHPKQVLNMLWDGYGTLYNVSGMLLRFFFRTRLVDSLLSHSTNSMRPNTKKWEKRLA